MQATATMTRARTGPARLTDSARAVLEAARRIEAAGGALTRAELIRVSGFADRSVDQAVARLDRMGLWRWEKVDGRLGRRNGSLDLGEAGAVPPSVSPVGEVRGGFGDMLLAAAGAILGRDERLTGPALADELGWTGAQVQSRLQHLRESGRWPYRLERTAHYRGAIHFARRMEVRRLVLAAAAAAADREERLDLADVIAGTGLAPDDVYRAVEGLRKHREWPYLSARDGPEPRADRAMIADLFARETARMGDGRDEVDDPVLHGATAPWSGRVRKRPVSLRPACFRLLREWEEARARTSPGTILNGAVAFYGARP